MLLTTIHTGVDASKNTRTNLLLMVLLEMILKSLEALDRVEC